MIFFVYINLTVKNNQYFFILIIDKSKKMVYSLRAHGVGNNLARGIISNKINIL